MEIAVGTGEQQGVHLEHSEACVSCPIVYLLDSDLAITAFGIAGKANVGVV